MLIGDHKQLPAVVQQNEEESAVNDKLLQSILLTNCRLSLFERLLKRYRHRPDVCYMLTRQGRMHPDIARFPNHAFYQDKLLEVPLPHQTAIPRRISFVAIPSTPHAVSEKVNNNEARAIAATVVKVYELNKDTFDPQETVGVIVPYRNQIAEVRNCIDNYGIDGLRDITIDTVERYQGSQRDYIIYGFTIQKYYQLDFLTDSVFVEDGCNIDRKLNVAMTRAREHLLMFGHAELLANNIIFRQLMEFARNKQGYVDVPLEDYIEGRFEI